MSDGPAAGDAVDVVIVGAGAAGLSLAHRLPDTASVVLVDAPAGPLRPPERTWCFWEEGPGEYDDAVSASWDLLRVRGADGRPAQGSAAPLRYKMLRSRAFEALVAERLRGRPAFRRVEAAVDAVRDLPGGGAEARGVAGDGRRIALRARWVFDSRPPRRLPPARTTLFQHFRGWFLRAERAAFEPGVADLMDFRVRQPDRGLSFGYVLPFGPREALVEYTEFTPALLDRDGYERALRHYTRDVLDLGAVRVPAVEQGVIPMTDAAFPRRAGTSVFRIGTAGGATRPATGYTFAAVSLRRRRPRGYRFALGRPPSSHIR